MVADRDKRIADLTALLQANLIPVPDPCNPNMLGWVLKPFWVQRFKGYKLRITKYDLRIITLKPLNLSKT